MSIYGKLGVINSNLMANAAYQGMESTNKLLSVHQNRIATLKKVNGSADDPAGFVMASGMKIEMDGMDVSAENIGSAQNMINIANNGASSIKDLLTEMRKKALEATDGSKSDAQRSAIQSQISQYMNEIQDTVGQTTWNGKLLLDGNASFNFQTGPNDSDTTNLAIGLNFRLGLKQANLAAGLGAGDVQFGADKDGAVADTTLADGGKPIVATEANTINADWTVEFTGNNSYKVSYTTDEGSSYEYTPTYYLAADKQFAGQGISLEGFGIGTGTGKAFAEGDVISFSTKAHVDADLYNRSKSTDEDSSYINPIDDMMDSSAVDGTSGLGKEGDVVEYVAKVTQGADLAASDTGKLKIKTRAYRDGQWGEWTDFGDEQDVTDATPITFSATTFDHHAAGLSMTFTAADNLTQGDTFEGTIQIAKDGHVADNSVNVDGLTGTGGLNLSTANGAKASLHKLDKALQSVDSELGNIGAMNKRLDIKSNLLEGRKTQTNAAVSRIEDADLISEQLQIAKLQVLQQANLSLMSQAQQAPRMVLQIMGIGG